MDGQSNQAQMQKSLPGFPPSSLPELTQDECIRYSRHLLLDEVGIEGQRRWKSARVLIVGAGGLGSPVALYLAAAGIGHLGIVDFDGVDRSNLQRQLLHGEADVGRPKVDSARERLQDQNPNVRVTPHPVRLTKANVLAIFRDYDVVVDGTDNFPTRYLINDACVMLGKPLVHGSIFRFEGQASVFGMPGGPCYRCLYPDPPPAGISPNCAEIGVLGVLPGVIGTLLATEVLKLLLGRGDLLVGRVLTFDAMTMRFREIGLKRDPHCPRCGDSPSLIELPEGEPSCDASATLPAVANSGIVNSQTLQAWLYSGRDIQLVDVREPYEFQTFALPGAKPIPLGEIHQRMHEIDPRRDTVVYCRVGVRSASAIAVLRDEGFPGPLYNLEGGILAWAQMLRSSGSPSQKDLSGIK